MMRFRYYALKNGNWEEYKITFKAEVSVTEWNWSSMACGREGSGMVPKMWDIPLWESVWPNMDPWDSVRLRTASTHWNVPKKYGPHGELFLFLLKKEPLVLSELVEFGPSFSAETVKGALIGLHMMAEEHALSSDRGFSPHLWRNVEVRLPKESGLERRCL